jgi:Epoxide hydrolase N terminus
MYAVRVFLQKDDDMRFASWIVNVVLAVVAVSGAKASLAQERPRVERFTVDVPEAVLSDLDDRLARTRWPDQLPGTDWSYGADTAYLRELIDYWQPEYDWREQERALNSFEH